MASFSLYVPLLTAVEGGYQNLAKDTGNYNSLGQLVGTNYGIAATTYEALIGRPPSIADMKAITKSQALQIMKIGYWDKLNASLINNQSIAEIIVDHAVNAGPGRAGKMIQTVLNSQFGYKLIVDGIVGKKSIEVINSVNASQLHQALKEYRKNHYKNIGGGFENGWLARLEKFVYTEKKKCF